MKYTSYVKLKEKRGKLVTVKDRKSRKSSWRRWDVNRVLKNA